MSKYSDKRLAQAVVSRGYVTIETAFDILTIAKRLARQAMQGISHLILSNRLIDSCIAEAEAIWIAKAEAKAKAKAKAEAKAEAVGVAKAEAVGVAKAEAKAKAKAKAEAVWAAGII